MIYSSKVPETCDEMEISSYLANRFTYLTQEMWSELVEDGRISCNGIRCQTTTIIRAGDNICCQLPEFEQPAVNFDYEIIYEDEWLLAVNKPPGLRVHSSGKFVNANLIYHLRHARQIPYPEINLINRLDADTSGIVLLAKKKEILPQMMRNFAENSVEKIYLAIVSGVPSPADGIVNLPIGRVADARVPRFTIDREGGKRAVTHYRTISPLGTRFSLLELRPETGRTHQLRVHLSSIGHPIVGDALYTMNDPDYLDWRINKTHSPFPLKRQALHSHHLIFTHPVDQTPCRLTAPLPPDLTEFMTDICKEDTVTMPSFH